LTVGKGKGPERKENEKTLCSGKPPTKGRQRSGLLAQQSDQNAFAKRNGNAQKRLLREKGWGGEESEKKGEGEKSSNACARTKGGKAKDRGAC